MKLNMYLILDWFDQQGVQVQSKILESFHELAHIRYLTNADDIHNSNTLYVVPNAHGEEGTILVHNDGVIYLKDLAPEYVFHELHAIIQYYQQIENQIITAALEDNPLQHLAQIASTVFESSVVIEGMDCTVLASAGKESEEAPNHGNPINCGELMKDLAQDSEFYGQKNCFLQCPVHYHNRQIGRILIYRYRHALSRGMLQFLSVFCTTLESIITLYPSRYLNSLYLEQMLTPILLGEKQDMEGLQNALSNLQWPIDSAYQVAVIGEFASYDDITECTAWLQRKKAGLYYISLQKELFELCKLTVAPDVVTHIKSFIEGTQLHLGMSYRFAELHLLPQMYEQAQNGCHFAQSKGNRICTAEESAYHALSKVLSGDSRMAYLSDSDIELLRRWDTQHQTAYLITLRDWILCKCNYVQCAQRLHTHTNTVRYRIGKIEEMISANLYDPRDRARLLISILALGL